MTEEDIKKIEEVKGKTILVKFEREKEKDMVPIAPKEIAEKVLSPAEREALVTKEWVGVKLHLWVR